MTIGMRLKEERERLGFTQPAFAGLAETTKKSQIDYEKDITQPKAGYLAVIAKVGADVQYIVTGVRSLSALAAEEEILLARYRASPPPLRNAALRVLLGGGTGETQVHQTFSDGVSIGQQISGDATFSTPVKIKMGGKKGK